jgi:glycosyltransferase involved in cell wall biosynthesis
LRLPRHYFLAVNRFIAKKNLTRLLLAYARYRSQRGEHAWKLVMLGDGPLRESLYEQCRDLQLEKDVLFPGFAQYDLLPAYYGLASAFVHASVVEQWGLVVNEAMAAGLPVIVSNRCGCVPELVSEGRNGFTFDPFDVAELTGLMARVSDHPNLDGMGEASRTIIGQWSPDRFAEGMLRAAETASAVGPIRPRPLDILLLLAGRYR